MRTLAFLFVFAGIGLLRNPSYGQIVYGQVIGIPVAPIYTWDNRQEDVAEKLTLRSYPQEVVKKDSATIATMATPPVTKLFLMRPWETSLSDSLVIRPKTN